MKAKQQRKLILHALNYSAKDKFLQKKKMPMRMVASVKKEIKHLSNLV